MTNRRWAETCPYCGDPLIGGRCPYCGYMKPRSYATVMAGGFAGEEQLTTDEFAALYLAEERRWVSYRFPFTAAPTIRRNTSSAFAINLETPAIQVSNAVAAASKVLEFVVYQTQVDAPFELRDQASGAGGSILDFPRWLRGFVGAYVNGGQPAGQSATQFGGIEFGSMISDQPFPAAPSNPVAQLRMRTSDRRIEFCTAVGDGVANAITDVINVGEISPHGVYLELQHIPDNLTSPGTDVGTINAYVDGVLVGSRSGADMPQFGAGGDDAAGGFVTTGSSASGKWNPVGAGCFFSAFELAVRYRTT